MKIPLKLGQDSQQSTRAAETKVLANDIAAAKGGDWNAKSNLIRTFLPLIVSLAEKRGHDAAAVSKYVEAGKEGLLKAVKKYKPAVGADHFRIFALDFIMASLDRMDKGGGFLARLFGR
jgi:DNA-directed RNA polymerase sigma subunit (sigma70/sigma32)